MHLLAGVSQTEWCEGEQLRIFGRCKLPAGSGPERMHFHDLQDCVAACLCAGGASSRELRRCIPMFSSSFSNPDVPEVSNPGHMAGQQESFLPAGTLLKH